MYTREEILNNFKAIPFPKSIFEESSLSNKDIILFPKSKPPLSSLTKDITTLSQSYVLPWRIVQQKNNKKNLEFSRGGSFIPSEPQEPVIEIKTENFKKIFEKFSIPLDKKLIYLKKGNNIIGPFNYDELENMYKNKKFDSNYEFRTIDLFSYNEEEPFAFHPLKNVNEDKWEINYIDTPLLEYSGLYLKVKELLEASKKRKTEINSLNTEIDTLKTQNEEKDKTIIELNKKIEDLEKELSEQKNLVMEYKNKEIEKVIEPKEDNNTKGEKIEDKKEEKADNIIIEKEVIEVVEKNFLYTNVNNKKKKKKKRKVAEKPNEEDEKEEKEDKEEKEEIIVKEKIEFQPKVLDMGEEWEIAGKKKKKLEKEKVKEEPKIIPKKEEPKKTNDLTKSTGSNKSKKNPNEISGEELVELLRPKKKEIIKKEIKTEGNNTNAEVKPAKGKGKKKNKRQYEDINIDLGFKY